MPQAVSDREAARVGSLGSVRVFGCRAMKWRGARRRKGAAARSPPQSGRRRETPRLGRRGAGQTRGKRDAEVAGKTTSVRQQVWGRGGDKPDAGEKSGKNAALDRPAPSCGIGKNDRDLVSRGTEQGAKDEQEGFRVYKPEVGRLLVGAYLRRCGWRTRGFVGCGGRPKRVRRRQRKLARRQRKLARRQRKLAERIQAV